LRPEKCLRARCQKASPGSKYGSRSTLAGTGFSHRSQRYTFNHTGFERRGVAAPRHSAPRRPRARLVFSQVECVTATKVSCEHRSTPSAGHPVDVHRAVYNELFCQVKRRRANHRRVNAQRKVSSLNERRPPNVFSHKSHHAGHVLWAAFVAVGELLCSTRGGQIQRRTLDFVLGRATFVESA
jgi:hypothetical protein